MQNTAIDEAIERLHQWIRETVVADTEQDFAIDFSERISAALLSTADRVFLI